MLCCPFAAASFAMLLNALLEDRLYSRDADQKVVIVAAADDAALAVDGGRDAAASVMTNDDDVLDLEHIDHQFDVPIGVQ